MTAKNSTTATEVLIIGAGAAGLMAGHELAQAGKKVIILEARERIGGRIWPLSAVEFGYRAEGGAEFVHGPAKITHELAEKAGLTLVPIDGEFWNSADSEAAQNQELVPEHVLVNEKLKSLKTDLPIAQFLSAYFGGEQYAGLRNSILRMVEGYDAADPKRVSTFALRDEWLGQDQQRWQQAKIKEGYGALLDLLETECKQLGVEILLNHEVKSINLDKTAGQNSGARIGCSNGKEFLARKVIVTLAAPTIAAINFQPPAPEKQNAAAQIGFGSAVKIIMKFKSQWWANALGKDFNKVLFIFSKEKVPTWWTQYPQQLPVLTGWIAGPASEKFKTSTDAEITSLATASLANIFKIQENEIKAQLAAAKVMNWPADRYTLGAYSYVTPETKAAQDELARPLANTVFFAGEALSAKEASYVEGALDNGRETAKKVLNSL